MSGVWGSKIKYSIFGESHGKSIGITIDGLPPGIELDLNKLSREMRRRAPGKSKLSTTRVERDDFEILSGYFNNKTTGTPLCAIIKNSDKHSKDYEKTKDLMRPGHADFTGYIKYGGFNDYRGGGHFSGRLTAPIVFAGAIVKQILRKNNIVVGSHIKSIGDIEEEYFKVSIKEELLEKLSAKSFATIDDKKGKEMQDAILQVRNNMDSIGGIIECAVLNLPPGLGNPFFGSVESVLSSLLFSIPAVKGVEFGAGFSISKMKGSEANDEFYIEDEKVKTYTNNNGGILGGITNGMPLIFRAAFKPTPSIAKEQRTVNILNKENTTIKIQGRHDPCIVQRAIPVVEAITAMGILELINI
ncbi:chorismate synthase [Clostridium botulinum C]|uniref:Chorismate synthase n=2 Tax=Clostridium botulinum TaxID=1491 RepID=A0A9Q4TNU6_CLOBO|nr:chorismate synthase [Clostridium botulinum]EGO88995.1 chorismate synthase [Clostridium botulinum C str. Stockholm]MCD3195421.1 chorismate synthase [Clostridium botulinum C]MCD3200837.1 chorismate synthase [Clostridium botulinum C]MCD3206245.1 chorismate synthase [Clostridium botulinum C]MCD3208763.1 chorismate synthase [Clostridium botulinum C]